MAVRLLLPLLLAAIGTVSLAPAMALAAHCPSQRLAAGSARPPETIVRLPGTGRRQGIVIVQGYASDPHDIYFFEKFAGQFPEYTISYYGQWGAEYETRGPFATSGPNLVQHVENAVRSDDLAAVHLVGHSMGGALIYAGLDCFGRQNNVESINTVASPLSHSTVAEILLFTRAVAGSARPEADRMLDGITDLVHRTGSTKFDVRDAAVVDLAAGRPARIPPGVRALQVETSIDLLVPYSDRRGIDRLQRHVVFIPSAAAHGLSMNHDATIRMVKQNIQNKPIDRPAWRDALATASQITFSVLYLSALSLVSAGAIVLAWALAPPSRFVR